MEKINELLNQVSILLAAVESGDQYQLALGFNRERLWYIVHKCDSPVKFTSFIR